MERCKKVCSYFKYNWSTFKVLFDQKTFTVDQTSNPCHSHLCSGLHRQKKMLPNLEKWLLVMPSTGSLGTMRARTQLQLQLCAYPGRCTIKKVQKFCKALFLASEIMAYLQSGYEPDRLHVAHFGAGYQHYNLY